MMCARLVFGFMLIVSYTANAEYDYADALHKSLLFYDAQRSGALPADNRVPWRGDSALNDRGQNREDLTGGYYIDGGFVKFGFSMASTTTVLAWGCLSYKDGYEAAGEWQNALKSLKWATNYFIKCHVGPNELYGQVGDFQLDSAFWGRPEEMSMARPAYKIDAQHPGSDLAGETAAALAATSLVFRNVDKNYSDTLLSHAKQLFDFADQYRGLYSDSIKNVPQYYKSTNYVDELAWAAAWLYRATNDIKYLVKAEYNYLQFNLLNIPTAFSYDNKVAGVQVLLAQLTGKQMYMNAVQKYVDYLIANQKKTPKGLVCLDRSGVLGHAANSAFIALIAADFGINSNSYRQFAKGQIDYALGAGGRSYVVGFGENPPQQPHHKASSCPDRPQPCGWDDFKSNKSNPQILYGALVSGPDENDFFKDQRDEVIYTKVSIDNNAAFQGTLAGLLSCSP